MRRCLFFFILWFFGKASAQHAGFVPMDGARFSTGDSAAWSAPSYDDSRWPTQRTGEVWQEQGYEGYHGYAWYRIHVFIASSLKRASFWKDSLRIFLAHVNDVDETFLNGVRIGKTGRFPEDAGGYQSRWPSVREYHVPIGSEAIRWDQDNVLAIRVYDGGGTGGIFMGHPYLDVLERTDGITLDMPPERIRYITNGQSSVELSAGNRFAVPVKGILSYAVTDITTGARLTGRSLPVTLPPFDKHSYTIRLPNRPGLTVQGTFVETGSGLRVDHTLAFPYTLTPGPRAAPRINGPAIYGARPGSPFLYRVPVTGKRPIRLRVRGLPDGLALDTAEGVIRGTAAQRGRYKVSLEARNVYGRNTADLLIVIGDTLSYTPALGWNSWNCWGLSVDQQKVEASAAAFIGKGLADHGWSYINIDDGWEAPERMPDGHIQPNAKFPDMKVLGDWLHQRGLKFGIYSSPGPRTCGGFLGSYQHETADAATYAAWGVDYLKYDWCSYDNIAGQDTTLDTYEHPYRVMQRALRAQSRDILYSLCQYGMKHVWTWGPAVDAQSWRTTGDIEDTWQSLRQIGFGQARLFPYAGPGHWNDPDMLTVGRVGWGENTRPSRLTPDEQYTEISLWSLLSAPLLLGCDLSRLDDFTLGLLTNDEVLAIDQDASGNQARRVSAEGGYQVWVKDLHDGSCAVGIFNMDDSCRRIHIDWASLGLDHYYRLRDVWREKDAGLLQNRQEATLMPHGVLLYRLSGAASPTATIHIDVAHPAARVPASLHGIFFEEISHAGDGGLYAEMIRNRGFEDNVIPQGTRLEDGNIVPFPGGPHFMLEPEKTDWKMEWPYARDTMPGWSVAGQVRVSLTADEPLNAATPHSLCVTTEGKADLVNEGYWGIPVKAGASYRLGFYLRDDNYDAPLTVSLQTKAGAVLARHIFRLAGKGWRHYDCVLAPGSTDPEARFVLSCNGRGTFYVDMISLFPEQTFRREPNGLRNDLAQLIAALKPSFVRWPGGCYAEGITIASAANWKNTIGPIAGRPGTFSPWGYWSTNGFGYDEYLRFCEDIGAAALFVCNAGVSCEYRSGTYVPEDSLQPYIQDALDAIEYAIGPVSSPWGKRRALAGHAKPYPLRYVEIGNEQHGPRYASRYNLFYNAIHRRYPKLTLIASMGIGDVNRNTLQGMTATEVLDEHAYKDAFWSIRHTDHFDRYPRGRWSVYVGEFATNAGVGHGNMRAALSDAIYMMGMERNADLVRMSSYAPLLANVHDVDWPVNLINFDASRSYARISYYAQRMFADNRPEVDLPTRTVVTAPDLPAPSFSGGIGLATWDTQTEYKDLEVVKEGRVVYRSNAAEFDTAWTRLRGTWVPTDGGGFAQTAEGAQRLALLKNHAFDTYTLTVKARKLGGYNAFLIPFSVQDSNTFLRAHIGSYVDANCVFESVTGGFDVADLTDQHRLAHPIETGRWYTIRLEVGRNQVDCFLDDTLLMSYKEPPMLFALAGRDKTGGVLLKVVNAGGRSYATRFVLPGFTLSRWDQLSAPGPDAENSLDHPTAYVPHRVPLPQDGRVVVPAYSISVMRFSK